MAGASDSKLANRILAGLVVGLVAGVVVLALGRLRPDVLVAARWFGANVLEPIGQVFLRMLFFVIIPLVFSSLASGVVQLGRPDKLGPLASRTFFFFFLNMAIAVALGLVVMNVVQPGARIDEETKRTVLSIYSGDAARHVANQQQAGITLMTIVEMFMPRNLFGAFVGNSRATLGDVLPLILFAILVGAVGTTLPPERRRKLQEGLDLVNELMTGIVHMALRLAPFAVPAMIFSVVVRVGIDIVLSLGLFVVSCAAVMALHLFGTMSVWLKIWTRWSPRAYFSAIKDVLVTAFSTSSSAATLSAALQNSTEKLKLAPSTAGFVLPLGTTMNMSGTALYEGCVVLFVAQVFGVDLGLGQQATLLFLSVLSAVAVAAIPGGSLPLIAGLLATFGIDPAGIAIILGVDRILDMCRTAVNVGCDVTTAVVVDELVRKRDARLAAG
ncbi:MAG TPA: dicarboxylate/amino acid:cation symporter [Opitutaceae bacterium]|nr:dicarboxylate/amino acid:cation symporter [Opitutaceae bacterium]